jgi:hypothetical protein
MNSTAPTEPTPDGRRDSDPDQKDNTSEQPASATEGKVPTPPVSPTPILSRVDPALQVPPTPTPNPAPLTATFPEHGKKYFIADRSTLGKESGTERAIAVRQGVVVCIPMKFQLTARGADQFKWRCEEERGWYRFRHVESGTVLQVEERPWAGVKVDFITAAFMEAEDQSPGSTGMKSVVVGPGTEPGKAIKWQADFQVRPVPGGGQLLLVPKDGNRSVLWKVERDEDAHSESHGLCASGLERGTDVVWVFFRIPPGSTPEALKDGTGTREPGNQSQVPKESNRSGD